MDFLRGLPWKWIVPVLLILALGQAVRARAAALGVADAAADRAAELVLERDSIADANEDLTGELASRDTTKDSLAAADSIRFAELDQENEELERELRNLALQDAQAAEDVDDALRDLGAVLAPEAMPALRELQGAYQARITGLSGQIVALTDRLENEEEENEDLRAELGAERFARSAADELLAGLRVEVVVLGEINDTQSIEIDALREAVAPGFLTRLGQNAGLAFGAAVFGGTVVYLALN